MKKRDYLYIALVVLAVLAIWNYGPAALSATGRFLSGGWAAMAAPAEAPAPITVVVPADTAPATVANDAVAAPALPAFTQQWEVPDGRWTPALTENLVIELAVQIRPDRPWEGTVGPVENQVYQFKTDYLDEDATTWQPGVHLYEFDLAAGWQPVFVGIQGDSPVQLCWMQEEGAQGAQLLMKTMEGNGTSALVFFTKTDKVPAGICP